ncbi:hypothetical protein [Streptomyces sp. NBC_01198]|uniref:hypothetical protein n=1 Tax=Streptomyces sp. NBC_01198 TaxID=2903769 RepID=UPI002E15FBDF|nr:hypothetical protein OG702_02145 [Streptomyces sp. NBC_01198]
MASRGAKAWRRAYQSGFSIPALSTADQLPAGQQSLSCQTTTPPHRSRERSHSVPAATARAWTSWVAKCQSAPSAGVGTCGWRPRVSLCMPSIARR